MWGWVFLILTWVWIIELSDIQWQMTCKDVEPVVQVVYKIPEPHMIVETIEKNVCHNNKCETEVSKSVRSVKGDIYPVASESEWRD